MNPVEFFSFQADERGKSYALRIARTIVRLFDISLDEAIGRINRQRKDQSIFGPDQIYRRDPEEWAKLIYYEEGTWWWGKNGWLNTRPNQNLTLRVVCYIRGGFYIPRHSGSLSLHAFAWRFLLPGSFPHF